jgi:hypothetical protein
VQNGNALRAGVADDYDSHGYPLLSATMALKLTNKIHAVADTDTDESIWT